MPQPASATWQPESWRSKTAHQQPSYPDRAEVEKACNEIRAYPPLIFAGECRNLQERLAKAASGEAFILQGGDCAEAFTQFSANRIRDTYRVLLQMSVVMMFGGGVPVIKLGRMAGQFAKPRWVEQGGGAGGPGGRGGRQDVWQTATATLLLLLLRLQCVPCQHVLYTTVCVCYSMLGGMWVWFAWR